LINRNVGGSFAHSDYINKTWQKLSIIFNLFPYKDKTIIKAGRAKNLRRCTVWIQ